MEEEELGWAMVISGGGGGTGVMVISGGGGGTGVGPGN